MKARYWELYESAFTKIASDIEAGFHTEFWNAYARAYEAYTKDRARLAPSRR